MPWGEGRWQNSVPRDGGGLSEPTAAPTRHVPPHRPRLSRG